MGDVRKGKKNLLTIPRSQCVEIGGKLYARGLLTLEEIERQKADALREYAALSDEEKAADERCRLRLFTFQYSKAGFLNGKPLDADERVGVVLSDWPDKLRATFHPNIDARSERSCQAYSIGKCHVIPTLSILATGYSTS